MARSRLGKISAISARSHQSWRDLGKNFAWVLTSIRFSYSWRSRQHFIFHIFLMCYCSLSIPFLVGVHSVSVLSRHWILYLQRGMRTWMEQWSIRVVVLSLYPFFTCSVVNTFVWLTQSENHAMPSPKIFIPAFVMVNSVTWLSHGLLSSKIGSRLCSAKLRKLPSFRKRPFCGWNTARCRRSFFT